LQRVPERVVFDLLPLFVPEKQFNETVKPSRDGYSQRSFPDTAGNGKGPSGTDPRFDFEKSSGFAEPDEIFGFIDWQWFGHAM
jgi:hypothetical protein